jgi:enediyne biosynthesis protein E4
MRRIFISLMGVAALLLADCQCRQEGQDRQGAKRHFNVMNMASTGVDFTNVVPDQSADSMNIIQYLYYYNGGGVAAGDFNNDGLCDLFFTANLTTNRLYLNRGQWRFDDVTAAAGVGGTTGTWNTGVSVADVNADGWLDIYVCRVGLYKRWQGRNQLWINQRDGTFRDEAAAYGLDIQAFSTQAVFFDYDTDGDLDCFLLCHSVHSSGSYRDTSLTRRYDPLAADRLLENRPQPDGIRRFVDVSASKGIYGGTAGYGLGVVANDFNRDGWPDLYVANDFHENDYLYLNQQGKRFRECVVESMAHTSNFSMGCDAADLNNDGWTDLVSLDMKPPDEPTLKASQPADGFEVYQYKHAQGYHWQFPRNALQIHQGNTPAGVPQFAEVAQLAGVSATDWSWAALAPDLDLDGHKDLYITNGIARRPNDMDYLKFISSDAVQHKATDRELIEKMPSGAVPNACFRNLGGLRFQDMAAAWGLDQTGCSNGAAWADLDNDGDLDLVTNNLNAPATLLRNDGLQNGHFLRVRCSAPGTSNTFGLGSRVEVWYNGKNIQVFENQPVRGFQSCVEPVVTVGLGAANVADSIRITWPDGYTQILRAIPANQTITVAYANAQPSGARGRSVEPTFFTLKCLIAPNPPIPQFFPEKLQPWLLALSPDHAGDEVHRSADFDGDGRMDRFTGRRFASGQYGIARPCEVVRGSDGTVQPLGSGDVAAVVAADLDGDGASELIVAGEWMPLTIWKHTVSGYKSTELEGTKGLWQSLAAADLDADGDLDFVAGNMGLNHDLGNPYLWVKDFDNNGQQDPVMAYTRRGHHAIFHDKDLITNQLPMLRKSFVAYRKYADSPFEAVITPDMQAGATTYRAEMLVSVWVENQGNNQWKIHYLPTEAQYSSVHAILLDDLDDDGHMDILLGGNLYAVHPAIGRMDASRGMWLRGQSGGGFETVPATQSGIRVEGEIREFQRNSPTDITVRCADGSKWQLRRRR